MKTVILAAGVGQRLDASKGHSPKPLTELNNGMSLLRYQLTHLSQFISLEDVFVVVGYHKEEIMEHFPSLAYVYNPAFAQENTAKSLLRAFNKIDEDVLWLNGDVIFRSSVIEKILTAHRTAMIVNETSVGEEEVKYRSNAKGQILEVSKDVREAQGEALGINFFKKDDLPILKHHLALCRSNDYFEKGIEAAIRDGVAVWKIVVEPTDCVEIDFPEDLVRANQMLGQWEVDAKD